MALTGDLIDAAGDRLYAVCIPAELAGTRLDQALVSLFPDYSRTRLQEWVRAGQVHLDGRVPRSRDRVAGGEEVRLCASFEADPNWTAEPLPLVIVFEDAHLLVVDKPAGLVTHPGAGNRNGTLLNGLLHHVPGLAALPRAGIVHRLDKETSGLLVVAKTPLAHQRLVAALAARTVTREYFAIARGEFTAGGRIEAPLGRHPRDRLRMAVTRGGKPAVTHYRVVERFPGCAHLRVRLETGRTHQIRVHLAHMHHPLVGDALYGGRTRNVAGLPDAMRKYLAGFPRQALHAARLALAHPESGTPLAWESPPPADLADLLETLRGASPPHANA